MSRRRNTFRLAIALALLPFAFPARATAQQDEPTTPDTILQAKLDSLLTDFHGRVGVYVRHLPSGRTAEINADELFPTASMIKVAILAAVFDRLERGELDFFEELTYTDSLLYPGEDILGSFADSATIPLAQVLLLMITTSDNTAALWAQHLAGTGTRINQWLSENGFTRTRVNSRTPGREDDRAIYGWGQTTPREMADLLVIIREGRAVSLAASEAMYRHLTRIYWTGTALSQIPPWVQAASKQGAVSQSRSDVVLVNAPSGDYVFCLITKDQEDRSWERDNEGFELLRKVSGALWGYFEPSYAWEPAPGVERYDP